MLLRDILSCWSVIPEKNVLGQKGNVRTGLLARRQNNLFIPVFYYMLPLKELVKMNIKCYPAKFVGPLLVSEPSFAIGSQRGHSPQFFHRQIEN